MAIIREMPYTNLHDLNIDWILKIIKDFHEKYENLDETFNDMLARIDEKGAQAIEAIQSNSTEALESIQEFTTQCITELQNTTNTEIDALTTAGSGQRDLITSDGLRLRNELQTMIDSLPETYQDAVNQLQIINSILNQDYTYPQRVQGVYSAGEPSTDLTASNYVVSTALSAGCAGRTIKIHITNGTAIIHHITWWTGWGEAAVSHTHNVSTSNNTVTDYTHTFDNTATYFSIAFSYDMTLATQLLVSDFSVDLVWKSALSDSVNALQDEFDNTSGAEYRMNVADYPLLKKVINDSNIWASVSSSSQARAVVISLPKGYHYIKFYSDIAGVAAFLDTYTTPESGDTPDFSDGYSGRFATIAGLNEYELNDETNYLYLYVKKADGTVITISDLRLIYTIYDDLDDRFTQMENDIETLGEKEYTLISNFMPLLFAGWFTWRLRRGMTNGGSYNSPGGFALTEPVRVKDGVQILNQSLSTDNDGKRLSFFVCEFEEGVFKRRYSVSAGTKYTVPENIDTIRIMYGYPSDQNTDISMRQLLECFAVKMLTTSKQADFTTPCFVAYGASTVAGAVHHFTGVRTSFSPFAFPSFVSKALNLEPHNHSVGSTGFLARGSDGNSKNILDSIYDDDFILGYANLVTIEFGYGNDRSAGLPIGLYTDYYPYDAEGYHEAGSAGISDMLSKGITLMGALNWCIKWISEKYPDANLVIIAGSPSCNADRTITISDNPERDAQHTNLPPKVMSITDPYSEGDAGPYTVKAHGEAIYQLNAELEKLKNALNIPIINLYNDGHPINYYGTQAKDADGMYSLFSTEGNSSDPPEDWLWNSHPNDRGYLLFSRFIAGQIIGLFNH